MGLQHTSRPLYGVQFHPESVLSEYGEEIIKNFKKLTKKHRLFSPPLEIKLPDKQTELNFTTATCRTRNAKAGPIDGRDRDSSFHVSCIKLSPEVAFENVYIALYGNLSCSFWLDSSRGGMTTDSPVLSFAGTVGSEAYPGRVVEYHMETRTGRQHVNIVASTGAVETREGESIFDFIDQFTSRAGQAPPELYVTIPVKQLICPFSLDKTYLDTFPTKPDMRVLDE